MTTSSSQPALAGKVALVTGGGTGIGQAIATLFAQSGAEVIVAGRRREPLAALAAAIGAWSHPVDVSKEADVQALFAACRDRYGRLNVLVNNAGSPARSRRPRTSTWPTGTPPSPSTSAASCSARSTRFR